MPKQLLVVDDELPTREIVAMYFKKEGYLVTKAGSGKEGMSRIAEKPFDIVILDVDLGDADGLDLLLDIKKQHPNLPVIIYTGQATGKDMIERAKKNGANGFLTKDQELAQMRDEVVRLVGK